MGKYGNHKIKTDEGVFDSKGEYNRWRFLKAEQESGIITALQRQVSFELIPTQRGADGKVIERACKYVADFVYNRDGETIVEDYKGMKTPVYNIKKKLMLERFGVVIREVR